LNFSANHFEPRDFYILKLVVIDVSKHHCHTDNISIQRTFHQSCDRHDKLFLGAVDRDKPFPDQESIHKHLLAIFIRREYQMVINPQMLTYMQMIKVLEILDSIQIGLERTDRLLDLLNSLFGMFNL
jgi:hypothetical protein